MMRQGDGSIVDNAAMRAEAAALRERCTHLEVAHARVMMRAYMAERQVRILARVLAREEVGERAAVVS